LHIGELFLKNILVKIKQIIATEVFEIDKKLNPFIPEEYSEPTLKKLKDWSESKGKDFDVTLLEFFSRETVENRKKTFHW